MEYFTTTSKPSRRAVDCVIVGVYERGKLGAGAKDIDAASKGAIRRQVKSGDVSGSLGRTAVLRDVPGVRAPRVIVAGLGKVSGFGTKQFRRAL
ncbi:MAG: M17 family peptidase N-terminal domain-containing protein, partial [Woeseiaceae bacterium]